MRAFARDLGISRTAVAEATRGSRRLSAHNLELVANALRLSSAQINSLKEEVLEVQENDSRFVMENDELDFIEDWYFLGILSLAKFPDAEYSAEWVSKKLGLQLEVSERALKFLTSRKFIENINGRLVRKITPLTTTVDIPSSSIVESHRQSLQKSVEALEKVSTEMRDFTSVTYAINAEQVPEVKKHILNFHRQLGKILETETANEVYKLNIQFFPLTLESHEKNIMD